MTSGVNGTCRDEIVEIDLELARLCDRRDALESLARLALGSAYERNALDATLEQVQRDQEHDPVKRAFLQSLFDRIAPKHGSTIPTERHDDDDDDH